MYSFRRCFSLLDLLHWGRSIDKKNVPTPWNVPEKVTPKNVLHNASRCTKKHNFAETAAQRLEMQKNRPADYLNTISAVLKHSRDSA
jgi:hypothetical protein